MGSFIPNRNRSRTSVDPRPQPAELVVREVLRPTALVPVVVPDDIVGAGIMPLPVPRVFSLLDWLEEQPGMDRHVAGQGRMRIGELGPLGIDAGFEDGAGVHGRAHPPTA